MEKEISLEDKIKLLTSKDTWSTHEIKGVVPSYFFCDGPHGIRKVYKEVDGIQYSFDATAFPSLQALSMTYNEELIKKVGEAIASEAIEKDVDIVLAPGVNIKRTPLCGRNFEYFSEDPYLTSRCAIAYINGIQDLGIGTSLKHFALNNREFDRFNQSSEVDERTLREIYLKPFEDVIKEANPYTIMCSYNLVNGVYASENKKLLNHYAREVFGYKGTIISDWGAVRDRVKSLKATIDIAFPYHSFYEDQLKEGLKSGIIKEEDLNFSVQNILNLSKRIEDNKFKRIIKFDEKARHDLCVEVASEAITLLKNEDNILPLSDNFQKIAVIGNMAKNPLFSGKGSSRINTKYKNFSLLEKLQQELPNNEYFYEDGYIFRYNLITPMGLKSAAERAYFSDKVILTVGTTDLEEKEETDKYSISLHKGLIRLIELISNQNKNVILVVYSGGPLDLKDIEPLVKAIVYVPVLGEGVNDGLAKILAGKVSPSGKLSETFPLSLLDTPTGLELGNGFVEDYKEKNLVGYRYYDTLKKDVLYPFGYGLSYATFDYKEMKITKNKDSVSIEVRVRNNSDIEAKEIVQVYVSNNRRAVLVPENELVSFKKILFKSKEEKVITFVIPMDKFKYYSTNIDDFYLESGYYEIRIGSSSRDIRLKDKIFIQGDDLFSRR